MGGGGRHQLNMSKRKLYPGYLVVRMEINEDTWFMVRETPGIGDFTGSAGKPTPMLASEVSKIIAKHEEKADEAPKPRFAFSVGDRVKINEGTFENFEGEVDSLDQFDELLKVVGIDVILLDNFSLDQMREAVRRRQAAGLAGKLALEASGGVDLSTVADIARTGVDRISVGALTHSAPALDISLDIEPTS